MIEWPVVGSGEAIDLDGERFGSTRREKQGHQGRLQVRKAIREEIHAAFAKEHAK